jgi:hypothetical protein
MPLWQLLENFSLHNLNYIILIFNIQNNKKLL